MTRQEQVSIYHAYIACLNARTWDALGRFVDRDVRHKGWPIGLSGYRSMLEGDVRAIPDLVFHFEMVIADPPHIASRLRFDCTPVGILFGIPVNGRRITFAENVLYEFRGGRILNVHSVIDSRAIAEQVKAPPEEAI